ncbi:MAG: hypothetical protein U5K54_03755 [Cytophagales bacterium]|nr:hypothetical protein [Cytophagales bacterium]
MVTRQRCCWLTRSHQSINRVKTFPKDVIERAAQLAAYNSKRKTESLMCPVIVTPKKFVRKRKGDPKGVVVVEKGECNYGRT